MIHQVHS